MPKFFLLGIQSICVHDLIEFDNLNCLYILSIGFDWIETLGLLTLLHSRLTGRIRGAAAGLHATTTV